jgi:hypothetical protein
VRAEVIVVELASAGQHGILQHHHTVLNVLQRKEYRI